VTTAPVPARARRLRRPRGDAGAAAPWGLIRLAVVLGVLGTLGYDAASVAVTSFAVHQAADESAAAAATSWHQTNDVDTAYRAALARAERDDLTIAPARFSITPDGTVRLRVHRTARTLVLARIGLRSWTEVTADSSARDALGMG
jgi:hypothetical protein